MNFLDYLIDKNIDNKENVYSAFSLGKYYSLLDEVPMDIEKIEFKDLNDINVLKMYERTLSFILYVSTRITNDSLKLIIEHSFSKGLYCEFRNEKGELHIPTEGELSLIKEKMKEIVLENHQIKTTNVSLDEAIEIYRKEGLEDKVKLLLSIPKKDIEINSLLGYNNSFYGELIPLTGLIKWFNIFKYRDGFVITYPTRNETYNEESFKPEEKLYEIFNETGQWNRIIAIENLGDLNIAINNKNHKRLVAVSEGLHEKKYSKVADEITKRGNIKVVLIAGPSSSGKTTSSKRLSIQLMVNGLRPVPFEMDNYFVNREDTPKLPDGSYDFESLRAVDLDLFNKDVKDLIEGREVKIPKFNFITGIREEGEVFIKLPPDGVLIIEGIHALNPKLLENIPYDRKFKIYASALTQLNIDNQNRISTTDVRRLRRMVRDKNTRGYSFEDTLMMFDKITKGEKQNIFPYQKEADAMFNTTLIYELAVLKKYALKGLEEIKNSSPVYEDAKRLINLLNLVNDVDDGIVMNNSIIREFIGGSFFDEEEK